MTTTAIRYETVIGIEVHAQPLAQSKMFCSCPVPSLESPPNSHVCPVCLGMPGVLPVINKRAVELTIMTGLALNCDIAEQAKFDRKNYHYPDLPKGYQISEYDQPLCKDGWLEIETEAGAKRIGITRVHLEEDTARSSHITDQAGESYSLVDVKVPIVFGSFPEVGSSEIAFKICGSLALKEACRQAKPIILEPIMKVDVTSPEANMGDVIGDLNRRRGRIQGQERVRGGVVIHTEVPLSEMFGYSTQLRSLSAGRATYVMEPSHFERVPTKIQEEIMKK